MTFLLLVDLHCTVSPYVHVHEKNLADFDVAVERHTAKFSDYMVATLTVKEGISNDSMW